MEFVEAVKSERRGSGDDIMESRSSARTLTVGNQDGCKGVDNGNRGSFIVFVIYVVILLGGGRGWKMCVCVRVCFCHPG